MTKAYVFRVAFYTKYAVDVWGGGLRGLQCAGVDVFGSIAGSGDAVLSLYPWLVVTLLCFCSSVSGLFFLRV